MQFLKLTRHDGVTLASFMLLMLATRYSHFGTRFSLPNASFAIFFLAGFYLRQARFFLMLAALTVVIDYFAITYAGVSNHCWTPAYAALILSYLVLWGGGYFSSRVQGGMTSVIVPRVLAVIASTSAAYLISDGAFYWLSGRYAEPNLIGYWSHMTKYFVSYVGVACGYIALVGLAHLAAAAQSRTHTVA